METNRNEVKRYLGYHGITEVDNDTEQVINECIAEMEEKVTPRRVVRFLPISWHDDPEKRLEFGDIILPEGALSKNLSGCNELAMLAVTLGPAPDMLTKRASLRETFRAMVLQATGAAMIEAYADEVNEEIRLSALSRGLYTRPRFSPGYGDFPLEKQKDFERILEMKKNIGVSLSESLLMVPTKSVTAVIGLSEADNGCIRTGCEGCNIKDTCEFSLS